MRFAATMLIISAAMLLACVLFPALLAPVMVQAQDAGAGGSGGDHAFVGNSTCKKCHSATFKSWEGVKHAKAFETLKPGVAAEAKTKFKLDPAKDYTADQACLKCHTTGLGKAGGYAVPDPGDEKAVRAAAKLEGVGCESCHGPGEDYNVVFKEIMTSQRKYKVEELRAVGLQAVTEATCTGCHNASNPTHDASKPFNFEEMKKKGVHEHVELKQREG